MHGPVGDQLTVRRPPRATRWCCGRTGARRLQHHHRRLAALALVAACAILSYSVLSRALFHSANYWQDEAAVFLLVGATFMTAGYVQSRRGHIGIEAFVGLLSPTVNRIRLWLVDVASFSFCAFFTWKSWTLAHEAWATARCRTRCGRHRWRSPMG